MKFIQQKYSVMEVNSNSEHNLDYDQHKNGQRVIAVGGNRLSRGLTLEGLSSTYFVRESRMYDTLTQMGRWFGFRPDSHRSSTPSHNTHSSGMVYLVDRC